MKKSKIISVMLITCFIMSIFSIQSIAATAYSTISGIISLPGKDVAPSGGVKVSLSIGTDNNTPNNKNDDKSVTEELTIRKGRDSIPYSIQVPKSQNSKAMYTVFYTVENGYAPFGWYSKDGTTAIKDNRTLVDINAGDVDDVDIELLQGRSISGEIILGNQSTKPLNDLKYTIIAIQEGSKANSNNDDIIVSKEVTVKANDDDESYKLIVPMNSAKKGYKVYYTYENGGYKEMGYYDKDGTSRDEYDVTLIDTANTVTDIDLTTLPFTNISGKVYLPDNEKAPSNGIEVIVTALNKNSKSSSSDDFSFSKTVKISKGSNSTSYNLTVPVTKTDYILSYKVITKNTSYITEGYYNDVETEKDIDDATPVETSNKAISGINLEIINKKSDTKPKPDDDEIVDKYDLNGDGYVNVFDMLDLAEVIVEKYEKEGFDKNLEQYKKRKLNEKDLEIIRDVFKPFTNNRYKLKWFNSLNKWFNFDFDYSWTNDWDDWEDYWEEYLEDWKGEWKKFNWDNWDDYCKQKKGNGWNKNNNKNKK